MNHIDKCSYNKVGEVVDSSTTPTTDIKEISMAKFGTTFIGTHYDQQLGYGYREIHQNTEVCLKLYKKVVLMDKVCCVIVTRRLSNISCQIIFGT